VYAPVSNVIPFPVDERARARLTFEQIRHHIKALDRFPLDDGSPTDHMFERIRLHAEMLGSFVEEVEKQFWDSTKRAGRVARMERNESCQVAGQHVFISYVREDSHRVDELQVALEAADVRVWRDTADLRPGEDWRAKIRKAIADNALVFIACFSHASCARSKSYQNEEITLAIEQMRLRRPNDPWLIPVRFDECDIPEWNIGGGRTIASIERVDLIGDRFDDGIATLTTAVLRILRNNTDLS
jgi:TIR domain